MNRSYIGYLKSHFKFLMNIFRSYNKKNNESFRLNMNNVKIQQNNPTSDKVNGASRRKLEILYKDTSVAATELLHSDLDKAVFFKSRNQIFDLSRKYGKIDLGIKAKLEKIPLTDVRHKIIVQKKEPNRVYAWQNFVGFRAKYRFLKSVTNVTREILNTKKKSMAFRSELTPYTVTMKPELKVNKHKTVHSSICINSPHSTNLPNFTNMNCKTGIRSDQTIVNQKLRDCRRKIPYFPKEERKLLNSYRKPKFSI